MRKQYSALFVSFVAAALVISSSCGKKGNPFNPSGGDGRTPDPPKPRYETLPAKHYLVSENGNQTEMSATLHWTHPERGFKVQLGPSACPNNCFRYSMEVGLDMIDGETNSNVKAAFETWFSFDGKNPIDGDPSLYRLSGGGVGMGQSQMIGSNIIRMFQLVPKYILVKGQYTRSWQWERPPPVIGSTSFEIDYQ